MQDTDMRDANLRDANLRDANLPLRGLRIVDLSAVLSGPIATTLLAAQGADVIKVEPPEGDTSRRIGPAKGDLSSVFITCNQGKRSVVLDLKQAAARDVLQGLIASADVLVENFRPGVLARLGLSPDELSARYPRLIIASVTGHGASGPYAQDRAYDAVIQATAGIAASHRERATGMPSLLPTLLCDKLTALTLAQAVTAALLGRERDGQGRRVEVAMLDASIAFQWPDAMYNHVFMDAPPAPFPPYGASTKAYPTRDGMVAVMNPQPVEFKALCDGLGRPDLPTDARFTTAEARMKNGPVLRAIFEPLFAQRDTDELMRALTQAGVPIGRVNELDDVLRDPQVLHNHTVAEVAHGTAGRVRLARQAARFGGQRGADPRPAPHLGEHGAALLAELGCDAAAVDELVRLGAVRLWTPRPPA